MIAIKYYKTIHILVDPNNDSVDNCERYSFLMYPFLDKFNDWWCFYKNDELEQIGIFNSYQETVKYVEQIL